jgi:hypothetical protein
MSVTSTTASLTVTTGPDRGQSFALTDEFIHIGSGPDSQVLLTDPQVGEHLASLANRNGRYAIFAPTDDTVAVDGNSLKADQWVWLPAKATIKVSPKTTLTFQAGSDSAAAATPTGKLPDPAPLPTSGKTKTDRRKVATKKGDGGGSTGRAVAKFITDRPGETLVKLGEDGHLPELALQETAAPKADKRKQTGQGNPALVYGVLGFSLLASVAMMFLEPQSFDQQTTSKAEARKGLVKFIGDEKGPVKPYQRLLREAGLAHSRGDFAGERYAYLSTLGLLNSEDKNPFTGITGSPESDDELRGYLATLISR